MKSKKRKPPTKKQLEALAKGRAKMCQNRGSHPAKKEKPEKKETGKVTWFYQYDPSGNQWRFSSPIFRTKKHALAWFPMVPRGNRWRLIKQTDSGNGFSTRGMKNEVSQKGNK